MSSIISQKRLTVDYNGSCHWIANGIHKNFRVFLAVAIIDPDITGNWANVLPIMAHYGTINYNLGIFLCMGSANERRHYNVMPPLTGWAHTQNDPCTIMHKV